MKTTMFENIFRFLIVMLCCTMGAVALAKSGSEVEEQGSARYIVTLSEPSLARWHARRLAEEDARLVGIDSRKQRVAGAQRRLDIGAPESVEYLAELDEKFARFSEEFASLLGRPLDAKHRYRYALNGMAVSLTPGEVERLAAHPRVKSVERERIHKLHTDAGPAWIGAEAIWSGEDGIPVSRGSGVIVGIIDSGINWEHTSFKDLGDGTGGQFIPYDHTNPLGAELGLCSEPEVECNDKLIGVWDFVTDDEDTETEEEFTNGWDNDGHGSHVAATAVGNTHDVNFSFDPTGPTRLSGVAPQANMISYRVCFIGDPEDGDDDGCQGSAILKAIDQAIEDGVDAVNYSIGSSAFSPWSSGSSSEAFLNLYAAGIFAATSAGNSGPGLASVGSPANAPWISAVANSTHDRIFGNQLENLSGGNSPPPGPLTGATRVGDSGVRRIVHARDYGNALCGDFTDTAVSASCDSLNSLSNPFEPGTFNGEIVVCDRGVYGRVEKGLNLKLAGAGGYILANTAEFGPSVVADNHCLPATHLTEKDGDTLRGWLATGSDHEGSLSEAGVVRNANVADRVNASSSRGPVPAPVEDVLKPNLTAPGTDILAAFAADDDDSNNYAFLTGTSMSSPHVAGAAALLISITPDWSPAMINSMLETTATFDNAVDYDGSMPGPLDIGSGRPRLGEAANAPLYLAVSAEQFEAANPGSGGDPGGLNLPGIAESKCVDVCSFERTVTARIGGSWTTGTAGFPNGIKATVSPAEFTLEAGESQALTLDIEINDGGLVGSWFSGAIEMTPEEGVMQTITAAVNAFGGTLPAQWAVNTNRNAGNQEFELSGLAALEDVTFRTDGLAPEQRQVESLPQDPSRSDPYDDDVGAFTVLQYVPESAVRLYVETLASTANDLDLFIGRDLNGDGIAQANEEICSSTSPDELELCDILDPPADDYWIRVQNWGAGPEAPDDATVVWTVITQSAELNLSVTAQGIVDTGDSFPVRVSWNNVDILSGESMLGFIELGTNRNNPGNVGEIPIRLTRGSETDGRALALMSGQSTRFALAGGASRDRLFIDVPESASGLAVSVDGGSEAQNDGLMVALKRIGFESAFDNAPVVPAAPDGDPIVSAMGADGQGPEVSVSGGSVEAGRWYVVVSNESAESASVSVTATVNFDGDQIPVHGGLWQPVSRPDISQGLDYAQGTSRALLWYTYDEQGQPAWYLAAGANPEGDVWVADLLRFTNDGEQQQETRVGQLAMTTLSEEDVIFSWQLFGDSGSDRMAPLSPYTCPNDGGKKSYTGIWYRGLDGLGGASVLVNATSQAQIHYLFDSQGDPRWLIAANDGNQSPTDPDITMLQFSGFFPNGFGSVTYSPAGLVSRDFDTESTGSWTLDYVMLEPLVGEANRTENIYKLTAPLPCN